MNIEQHRNGLIKEATNYYNTEITKDPGLTRNQNLDITDQEEEMLTLFNSDK